MCRPAGRYRAPMPTELGPEDVLLSDAGGIPLARYRWRDDAGERVVSGFRPLPGASAHRIAVQAVRDLPGRRVTMLDEQVARALADVGCVLVRAATDLHRDLTDVPAPQSVPDGWTLAGHGWDDDLTGVLRDAYPPDHPDHGDRVTRLRGLLSGDRALPLLPGASARLRDPGGRSAGQVLTVGPVPWGGRPSAWVLDVAVAPRAQGHGFGAALLIHAMGGTRDAGLPTLGLTVTDGNPARRLYDRMGFHPVVRTFTMRVPVSPPAML